MFKSRRLRNAEHVARMEEDRNYFNILRSKHIDKRLLGRPGRIWRKYIKMDLKEISINQRN